MQHKEARLMVLARIPNLSATGPEGESGTTLPAECGRLISQVVSFRLLAATALLLLLVAIMPFSLREKASPPATIRATPSTAASDVSALQPDFASIAPTAASVPPMATGTPPTAANAIPQMSSWPNPAQSASPQTATGGEGPQSGANQPMTIPPPFYQADARAAYQEPAPGASPFKGPIQKPVIQNSHDRTRSSIH